MVGMVETAERPEGDLDLRLRRAPTRSTAMADAVDPSQALPAEVPDEIRDFVACRSASLTIEDGELGWLGSLPLPGGKPSLSIQPGDEAGTAILKVSLGWILSVSLRASVANGALVVDTSGLPGSPATKDAIQAGIRDVNDWFRQNGKQLGPPTISRGSVTLTKVDLASAPGKISA
jgi:hypothetical protein